MGIGFIGSLLFAVVTLAFALIHIQPSLGADLQYPLSIPPECTDLAQRKGQPLVIETKKEAIRAKYKLWRMKDSEAGVKECRDAVKKIEDELKAQ